MSAAHTPVDVEILREALLRLDPKRSPVARAHLRQLLDRYGRR